MKRSDFIAQVYANNRKSKSEESYREFFEIDRDESKPFSPAIRAKDEHKDVVQKLLCAPEGGSSTSFFTHFANEWCRSVRNGQYKSKINGSYTGIRIVSEGDSWFQYPFFLKDIIDYIDDEFAVRSLGAAGDTMSDMLEEKEYLKHIKDEDADVFLFSGGGNDMLGNGGLVSMLHQYDSKMKAEDYLNNVAANNIFETIKGNYSSLIQQISDEFPNVHILIHGYDYILPDPNNGKYLWEPMNSRGILVAKLKKDIARVLINRFNLILERLSDGERVHYINCRDSINDPSYWDDEIHPTSKGFKLIAERFKEKLNLISSTLFHKS